MYDPIHYYCRCSSQVHSFLKIKYTSVGVLESNLRKDCLIRGISKTQITQREATQGFLYRFEPSPGRITTLLLCVCIEYAGLQDQKKHSNEASCAPDSSLPLLLIILPFIQYSERTAVPLVQRAL